MKDTNTHKALTIKTLTKHNVWDIEENDVFKAGCNRRAKIGCKIFRKLCKCNRKNNK